MFRGIQTRQSHEEAHMSRIKQGHMMTDQELQLQRHDIENKYRDLRMEIQQISSNIFIECLAQSTVKLSRVQLVRLVTHLRKIHSLYNNSLKTSDYRKADYSDIQEIVHTIQTFTRPRHPTRNLKTCKIISLPIHYNQTSSEHEQERHHELI